MHRQRLFDLVCPVLLGFVRDTRHDEAASTDVLIALAHVIAHSPKAIYMPHVASILPLMVQAINSSQPDLGSSAIKTFKVGLLTTLP